MSEPKKNAAFIFITQLVSQANAPDFQANPTLAAGDVTVSVDGANPANITTLPTAINSGANVKVSLSAAEMNGDYIAVLFSDAAGAEWHDTAININTLTYTTNELYTAITAVKQTTVQIDQDAQTYSADEQTDYIVRVDCKDTDGSTPLNVGDATEITYTVSDNPDSTTAHITKTKTGGGITVTNGSGTNDRCEVAITEADTTGLTGRYYHQLLVEDAAGDVQVFVREYIQINSRYV